MKLSTTTEIVHNVSFTDEERHKMCEQLKNIWKKLYIHQNSSYNAFKVINPELSRFYDILNSFEN